MNFGRSPTENENFRGAGARLFLRGDGPPFMGTSADPWAYGELVSELCFPDILRYEVATPAVFGFAEHNGRALADNAPEVMFSIVVKRGVVRRFGQQHCDRHTSP